MRSLLLPVLLLASCVTPDARPAITAITQMRVVFDHAMDGNEALVRRSGPSMEALNAYLLASNTDRAAFAQVQALALQAIGSIGAVSPEQIEQTTAAVIALITAVKK